MLISIAIGCWVLLAVAVIVLDTLRSRRRERLLERVARDLGFECQRKAKPFVGSDVQGLTLLQNDPNVAVTDLLIGQHGGCSMMIFDVACCEDFAVNAHVTTCTAFRSPAGHLPSFQLKRKDVVERVLGLSAKERGICAGDDEFAKRFSVHCTDDGEARNLFTRECVGYLREHAEVFRIECSADWMLIYRPGVKVSARELATFVNATSALASVLLPDSSLFIPAA